MTKLLIHYRDKKLNTQKAATRKPVLAELARRINSSHWFREPATSKQLDGKVRCSEEAKKRFLGDHPHCEWVFEKGLGPPGSYQEIWSNVRGKGRNIRSANELAMEVDSEAGDDDEEYHSIDDSNAEDLHPNQ
ncbi:hypothetical protein CGRA01v4_11797 [Colletotrichum graminicola]|nr:hypothetical protein CGRA01v4_11797 [Colletotrichum graminicola]